RARHHLFGVVHRPPDALRAQDGVRRAVVAHLRLAACRALALRLAWPHRAALDGERVRRADARLPGGPLRARKAAATPPMPEISVGWMLGAFGVLLALSAFFSIAETAMMAFNRYRLRHLVAQGRVGAVMV